MKKADQGESSVDNEELPQGVFGSAPWILSATRFIDRLLMLPTSAFWSTMGERREVVHWLDDVVAWFPRPYELDRQRALDGEGDVLASVRLLKGSALALFLRIAVYDKERDQSMSAVDWMKTSRPVLPLSRFARWTAPFAPPHDAKNKRNRTLFAKALERLSNVEGARSSEDMITLEGTHIEELTDLRKDVDRISAAWNSSRGVKRASIAEILLQFLEGAVDWLYCALSFYRVAEAAKLRCRPAKLAPEIASTVDHFCAFLTTENVQEVAMHLADYPLRKVLRLRTQLDQFGVELVHDLLMGATAEKRAAIVIELLVSERFLYSLNDRYPLAKLVEKGTASQKENVNKILESVKTKQEKAVLSDMSRLGLVKNLGSMSSMPQRVAVAVDEVMAILPHLSTPYVHACLRHVGYDANEAIDMIVSQRVPGWLRRLEGSSMGEGEEGPTKGKGGRAGGGQRGAKKWFERMQEPATVARPPLTFGHEDVDLSEVVRSTASRENAASAVKEEKKREEGDGKNVFKGLFSMAPAPKKEEPKVVEDVAKIALAESRTAAAAAMVALREGLERMKVRAHGEDQAFGMENEKLVHMKGSKTHATADKYKTTAADKASLRPFYERFKYETERDERDEDMYNDEYDDGYEEKAFKTDPIGNDETPSDDEKKRADEREERGGGGGGRGYESRRGGGGGGERGGRLPMRGGGGAPSAGRGGGTAAAAAAGGGGGGAATDAAEFSTGGGNSRGGYTGGRQRQIQEKNKNKFRQRGADRKTRGML